ncbi:MAG: transglycosylase SLT domain-containing protein [Pseudomonadota bacterium]
MALAAGRPALAADAAAAARSTGKSAAGKAGAKGAETTPGEQSLSQRRAVRGVPVDDGVESPELGELRRFEEEAFPRGGAGSRHGMEADAPNEPVPALPGRWEGTGDVAETVRAPETTLTPPRPAPAAPDSDWLRSLKLPDLPIRWDPQVLRYLDYFKNDPRGRSIMSNWLRRGGRFRPLFEAVLEREGLPKDLFYVAMVESGFEPGARSPVGAGGVWQFMPGAARAYGLEVGYWVDARRDPERSVEAAARYLKDLYVRFGSWPLAFAAYNAGYGAVLKSITRYNTNDFWELCHHEAGLPWESSLYVPKILAAAIVGRNVEAFGYGGIVPDPPFVYDRVEVPSGTGLATVARAAKTRPEVIAALNPQILRERTPPDRGRYVVRVPAGTGSSFGEGFERSRTPGDNLETVTLRFGETLDAVAKARGVSVRELRRLNSVKDTSELRAGLAIVVPPRSTKATKGGPGGAVGGAAGPPPANAGATPDTDGGAAAVAGGDDEELLVAVPDRVFNYEGRERVFYRTRDGDSLDDIAEAVGVRPDDLVEWNNLDATAKLHPRMVLQIYVRKDFDPTGIVLLDPARVRVVTLGSQEFLELEAARRGKKRLVIEAKAGDTLAKLGRRYGLTVGDLARINRFSYNTDLQGGQKVVVYSPVGEGAREVAQGMTGETRRDRVRGPSGSDAAGRTGDKGRPGKVAATAADDKGAERRGGKSAERVSARDKPRPSIGSGGSGASGGRGAPARAIAANGIGDRSADRDGLKAGGRNAERAADRGAGKTVADRTVADKTTTGKTGSPRTAPRKR